MSENLHFTEVLQKEPVAVLTRYLEGELSVEETQQLEQVMAEDPFMADALEGLRTMPEPARAQAIGQELKFKAHKLIRSKRPIISLYHFNQYATAAVAVLVILFVATAAIMLTSRLHERTSEAAPITENVMENPEGMITENVPAESTPDPKAEDNNNFSPVPAAPQKTEIEKKTSVEIADNTVPTPVAESPQTANESKKPATVPTTVEDAFADEDAEEEHQETNPNIGNTVTMEAEDVLPPDPPTLGKDQLESYKQALTEGEYNAYKQALTKLENSLVATSTTVPVDEISSRTSGVQVTKERERAERKRAREQERNAKKRADNASRDYRKVDSAVKNKDLVDRDRRNLETTVDDGFDDFEVNENLLKQQLYTDPTNGENWLRLGQYYMDLNQYIKAEPYLKGAASSGKLSVVQEANKLLEEIRKEKRD